MAPGNRPATAIELFRRARGLSREQLAGAIGVHRETIARLERGTTRPRRVTALALAAVLEVPAEALSLEGAIEDNTEREAS